MMAASEEVQVLAVASEEQCDRWRSSWTTTEGDDLSQEKHDVALTREKKLAISVIAISNFCVSLSASMMAPFFPQEAEAKGASDTTVGFIFGISQLTICVLSPVYGSMVSHTGPRYLSLCGLLMCSVCALLFGTLSRCPNGAPFVALSFACTIVDANGAAMLATASYSTLAVKFPKRLSLVMGILETCDGAAYLVGPFFGGLLYSIGGFELPFFVVGGLQLISLVVMSLFLPSVECEGKRSSISLSLLVNPGALLAFLLIFSEIFALSFMEPVLGKELLSINPKISTAVIGAVFMVECVTYSVASPLGGWLCDKGYVSALVLGGPIITALSLLVVGPSPLLPFLPRMFSLDVLWIGVLGFGVGISSIPAFQMLLSSTLNAGHSDNLGTYGIVSGVFNCGWALGAFAGPSLAGVLTQSLGFRWATTLSAAPCLLVIIFVAAFALKSRAKVQREAIQRKERRHKIDGIGVADERQPLLSTTSDSREDATSIV